MGCICATNIDIAKIEAEMHARNKEMMKDLDRDHDQSLTPEIPSIHSSIQTNLELIPDLTPIQTNNITPLPKDVFDYRISNSYEMDIKTGNKPEYNSKDEEYEVEITFNSTNNEIILSVSNDILNKKWIQTLQKKDLSQLGVGDFASNEAIIAYNKVRDIMDNGIVKCVEIDDAFCQVNLLKNDETFEFVVAEHH